MLCILSFLFYSSSIARDKYDSIQYNSKYILKFSATGLFDPRPFIDIGLEYKINPKISIENCIGIYSVYFSLYASGLANSDRKSYIYNKNLVGLRYRGSIKYYPYKIVRKRKSFPYIGAEIKYNYYQHSSNQMYSRFGGSFQQIIDSPIRYNSLGVDFKFGRMMYMGKHQRAIFEFYTGIGYKYTHIAQKLPGDVLQRNNNRFFALEIINPDFSSFTNGNFHSLDFLFGFKFGYIIK